MSTLGLRCTAEDCTATSTCAASSGGTKEPDAGAIPSVDASSREGDETTHDDLSDESKGETIGDADEHSATTHAEVDAGAPGGPVSERHVDGSDVDPDDRSAELAEVPLLDEAVDDQATSTETADVDDRADCDGGSCSWDEEQACGLQNEPCDCVEGQQEPCGSDVGNCSRGTRLCIAGRWGQCEGEVSAQESDNCETAGDDSDCNGVPNERCGCVGNEVQVCNGCGQQQCDPIAGAWGACRPEWPPPPPRCSADESAVETCDDDGDWHSTPCDSSDPINCRAACELVDGESQCIVTAQDADGDGFGSTACADSPGPDCDDATASIYPGATEVCDGLDNDCDSAFDLEEGFLAAGVVNVVANRHSLDVIWNQLAGEFGWVGESTIGPGLYFGTLSREGAIDAEATSLFAAESDTTYGVSALAFASSHGAYGVVFQADSPSGATSQWLEVEMSGSAATTLEEFNTPASLVASHTGDMVIVDGGDALRIGVVPDRRTTFWTFSPSDVLSLSANAPQLASNNMGIGVAFMSAGACLLAMTASDLTFAGPLTELSPCSGDPHIASRGVSAFSLAWWSKRDLHFEIREADSSLRCENQFMVGEVSRDLAIVDNSDGAFVFASNASGGLSLFRFGSECVLLDEVEIANSQDSPARPRMAASSEDIAMTWTDQAQQAYLRVMPSILCAP